MSGAPAAWAFCAGYLFLFQNALVNMLIMVKSSSLPTSMRRHMYALSGQANEAKLSISMPASFKARPQLDIIAIDVLIVVVKLKP